MEYFIPLLVVLCYLICRARFGKPFNPIFLIVLWWFGLLELAQFSIFGIDPPTLIVNLMTITMIGSLVVGALLASPPGLTPKDKKRQLVFTQNRGMVLTIVGMAVFFYLLYAFWSITGSLSSSDSAPERIDAMEASRQVISGAFHYFVYEYGVMGLGLLVLVSGAWGLVFKRYQGFVAAVAVALMTCLATRNRFNLYILPVMVALALICTRPVPGRTLQRRQAVAWLLPMLLLFGVFAAMRTSERSTGKGASVNDIAMTMLNQFVNYHTIGFAMMNQELESQNSLANTTCTFGRSIIGGADDIFINLVLKRFTHSVEQVNWVNMEYRNDPVQVGFHDGIPITANAFYTVMHTLYIDGRWVAVVVFPCVFGWIVVRTYFRAIRTGFEYEYMWLSMQLFIALASAFQSPLEEARTWSAMLGLFLLARVPMKKYLFAMPFALRRARMGNQRLHPMSQEGP